jgi:adenylate cyclase
VGKRGNTRTALFVGVCALTTAIALASYAGHVLRSLELRTVDTRFSVRGQTGLPKDVVVVAIDDKTFSDFSNARMVGPWVENAVLSSIDSGPLSAAGRRGVVHAYRDDLSGLLFRVRGYGSTVPGRWPFARRFHADVIDKIAAQHPKAIAIDIQFTEPTDVDDDNALIGSVSSAGHVVLAATEVDNLGRTDVFGGYMPPGAYAGNANIIPDADGVMRRVPYSVDGLTTFGVAAAAVSRGDPPPKPRGGSGWIDFTGPPVKTPSYEQPVTIKTYSYSDVYYGKVPPNAFRGKVVVVGPTAPSLQDVHATSASGSEPLPGAEIQANIINTALHGFPLKSTPVWLNVLLILLLGMVPAVASLRLRAPWVALVAVGTGALFAVATQLLFNNGWVVSFTYPILALALSAVAAVIVHYVLEAFERALTRDVFARFVPEAVVDQVLARTGGELRLGGEKVFGTAMFTDLRGFTTFSETLAADQVIGLLNRYLGIMSDVVLAHGGTLVTYTGDGMMAVFGAPLPQEDHADRALAAAREMLEVRLPAFNDWLHGEGHDYSFKMGVGLNSGDFMSGNVGSQQRLEYTAIGDTINTCSRIEGLTKGTPYALFIAGSTKDTLREPPDDLLYYDEMPIRGRAHTIPIWTLSSELILKKDWESEGKSPAPAAAAPVPSVEAPEEEPEKAPDTVPAPATI